MFSLTILIERFGMLTGEVGEGERAQGAEQEQADGARHVGGVRGGAARRTRARCRWGPENVRIELTQDAQHDHGARNSKVGFFEV